MPDLAYCPIGQIRGFHTPVPFLLATGNWRRTCPIQVRRLLNSLKDTEMSFPFELPILDKVSGPEDLRKLSDAVLDQVAKELRNEVIEVVSQTGGHLGSSLGVVELTVALHAIFKTPLDKLTKS